MTTPEPQGRVDLLRAKWHGATFSQIDALYAGIVTPKERGGVAVGGTRYGKPIEMTWTPEQLEGAEVALGYLTDLARGVSYQKSPLGDIKVPQPTLTQRIVTNFEQSVQQGYPLAFITTVDNGVYQLFQEFGRLYPEWTPAMQAIFVVAGEEGTNTGIKRTYKLLLDAIDGNLTDDNASTFGNDVIVEDEFALEHANYVVLCTGKTMGRLIFTQARTAARIIRQHNDWINIFTASRDRDEDFKNTDRLIREPHEFSDLVLATYTASAQQSN